MSAVNQLLDNLRIGLPGALDGTIRLELFNTVDELCRTAKVYRTEYPVTLLEGVTTYDISVAGKIIVTLYAVAHDRLDLSGAFHDQIDGQIVIPDVPTAQDVVDPLLLDVALAPAPGIDDPAAWMPKTLYERYYQALLHGTLARMMSQTAKPYSDRTMATYHGRRFRNLMALARHDAVEGGAPAAQPWRFPKFGR